MDSLIDGENIHVTNRPSPQLHLDVSSVEEGKNYDVGTSRNRGRARTISKAVLPSFLSSSPPSDDTSPTFPSDSLTPHVQKKPSKALNESRKLLAHILDQLEKRPRAPFVLDEFGAFGTGSESKGEGGIDGILQNVRAASASKRSKSTDQVSQGISVDDQSDDEETTETVFSTDVTFDLMNQLKDVLLIAHLQKWLIFDDGVSNRDLEPDERASFRFRRTSFQSTNRRSRSPSPRHGQHHRPGLLSACIAILASVVSEDCRFQISSPKLMRPPYVLQALTLDVAQFLVYTHRNTPKVLYTIGLAMIPAFSSFKAGMQRRLLAFFEESLITVMLQNLKEFQTPSTSSSIGFDMPVQTRAEAGQPIVAIQVEQPHEDSNDIQATEGWLKWSTPQHTCASHTSTNAASQQIGLYYVSSIIPPMLAAILEHVDLLSSDLAMIHRAHRLIQIIVDSKADAHIDILEVLAYHSNNARYSAITILATFWPKSLGHVVIGKAIPTFSYVESLHRSGLKTITKRSDRHYDHQFVPWYFPETLSSPEVLDGFSLGDCRSCSKRVNGFGLLCPFCMCTVHFDCYDVPDGSVLSHYQSIADPHTERVAIHRFSGVFPARRGEESYDVQRHDHTLNLVNIFTLSLCAVCRRPLWGCVAQGLHCERCNCFVHVTCVADDSASQKFPRCQEVMADSSYITISWDTLRESFIRYYHGILLTEEDLAMRTHEEVSIYWCILWTQMQLLHNGLSAGSIVVEQKRPRTVAAKGHGIDDFELQYLTKLYEAYLRSGRLAVAQTLEDFKREDGQAPFSYTMLFDWSTLTFITSVIKTPPLSLARNTNIAPSSLLNVDLPAQSVDNRESENQSHPFESMSLARIRDVLGTDVHLHDEKAACILIGHLHHLGFLEAPAIFPGHFATYDDPQNISCSFPIPLGIDLSSDVETLVVAAEVCLGDLDVSINEVGFLFIVRKLWPNGMSSEYALGRVARAILLWLLNEDESLMTILRDYVARGRTLPGVPSVVDSHSWPSGASSRSAPTSSVNNGGDHVARRKSLLTRYAAPWLLALHNRDRVFYSHLLFNLCTELATESDDPESAGGARFAHSSAELKRVEWAERVFRYVVKLHQSTVAFSAIDDLLPKFLDAVLDFGLQQQAIVALPRLFNRDVDTNNRTTVISEIPIIGQIPIHPSLDPWRVVMDEAARNGEGLSKSIKWLRLFATSAVDIPITSFLRISAFARDIGGSFEDHAMLAEATLMSTWMVSLGRQDLQAMISELHTRQSAWIRDSLRKKEHTKQIETFIRQSLATCLLLYGCERRHLLSVGMVKEHEINHLPSRRKASLRPLPNVDPVIVDIDLIAALTQYVNEADDSICCIIATFLTSFVTEAALLEPFEIDNFILRNSHFLTTCAWRFYDMNNSDISALRPTLLLRILVVDTQAFDSMLQEQFDSGMSWEIRLRAAAQLFRVILDATSPFFHVEGRQWRASVTNIFHRFFTTVWIDPKEEIRLATDTWAQTLQPAHFDAITLCWNESLVKSPIADRVKLVAFLLQLRPHFPSWKVLAWDVIIETLIDDDYSQRIGDDEEGPASAHLSLYGIPSTGPKFSDSSVRDPDLATLQTSLVLLSLQMVAEGIPIDLFSLLKIKYHLVILLGFTDVALAPAPNGHSFYVRYGSLGEIKDLALPCFSGLVDLLDAFHYFDLPASAMTADTDDSPCKLLVGAAIIDVVLFFFNNVNHWSSLPFLTKKMLLQSLIIIIYKHDLDAKPLQHLKDVLRKAVRRVTELLLQDISYELRQLTLSVFQAYLRRWPHMATNLIIHQIQSVITTIFALQLNGEDVLVSQAASFLETILSQFSLSGLFYQLCKRKQGESFFSVVRHVMAENARVHPSQGLLRETILRDTLTQAASQPSDGLQNVVLENIRIYIEVIHHQSYPSELMSFVGRSLFNIMRNASETNTESFDPNPVFSIVSTLVQHNKAQSRELLGYTEQLLRMALVRFDVNVSSLKRLLHVTSTLYRRNLGGKNHTAKSVQPNNIILVMVEILSDSLRGKARTSMATLGATMEALCDRSDEPNYLSKEDVLRLGADGFLLLQSSPQPDFPIQRDLATLLTVCSLVLWASEYDTEFITRHVHEQATDRTTKAALSVRSWNLLALNALQSPTRGHALTLLDHLSSFSATYYLSLRMAVHSSGLPPDISSYDVNQAFFAIKLWLLLSQKCGRNETTISNEQPWDEDGDTGLVWNELWPAFERLLTLSQMDAETGNTSPICSIIWTSAADIYYFLRQIRCVIGLESSSHIASLNKGRGLGLGESSLSKFSRAVQSMSEPPHDVTIESLADQIVHDMVAVEKLHALADAGRIFPDKARRDVRGNV
ncbi:hypothetical protein BD410DRAFT_782583 [Rickenella mellea]|uniref:Phorbol-ester/DAG-type domain-containing protein n=1 Tax=Rickenella mellea TaxID=50990 RepID=A0A4Y7QJC3_9AGAM|nr:hypothetical protein BD410DRAFT_782583 [Rickenella mellea]